MDGALGRVRAASDLQSDWGTGHGPSVRGLQFYFGRILGGWTLDSSEFKNLHYCNFNLRPWSLRCYRCLWNGVTKVAWEWWARGSFWLRRGLVACWRPDSGLPWSKSRSSVNQWFLFVAKFRKFLQKNEASTHFKWMGHSAWESISVRSMWLDWVVRAMAAKLVSRWYYKGVAGSG